MIVFMSGLPLLKYLEAAQFSGYLLLSLLIWLGPILTKNGRRGGEEDGKWAFFRNIPRSSPEREEKKGVHWGQEAASHGK